MSDIETMAAKRIIEFNENDALLNVSDYKLGFNDGAQHQLTAIQDFQEFRTFEEYWEEFVQSEGGNELDAQAAPTKLEEYAARKVWEYKSANTKAATLMRKQSAAQADKLAEALEPFVQQYQHMTDDEIIKVSGKSFSERYIKARAALKAHRGE